MFQLLRFIVGPPFILIKSIFLSFGLINNVFFKSSEILNCLIYRLIYSQSMDPFFTLDFICFKTSSKTLKSWNNYCVSKDGSSFITRQNDRDIFESHVASIWRLPHYCCQVAEKDWNIYSLFCFLSRQLHGHRIALHKNLFVSLLFNAVFEIWFKTGVLLTAYDDTNNGNKSVLKQVHIFIKCY